MALLMLARRAARRADATGVPADSTVPRDAARAPAPREVPAASGDVDVGAEQDKLRDKLISFIPAETLAPTVALFGFFAEDSWWWRLGVFVIFVPITAGWIWFNYYDTAKDPKVKATIPVRTMVLGTLAYIVWIGSVPASPYLQWHVWNLKVGAGLVLAGGVVFVFLDKLFKILDDWRASRVTPAPR
jgi:hypothetical protein